MAVGGRGRGRRVREEGVGERAASAVEEQKEQRDLNPFGGEVVSVGVAGEPFTMQQTVALSCAGR